MIVFVKINRLFGCADSNFFPPGPSQVVVSKTISDQKKVRSVATKVCMQILAKLGGENWRMAVSDLNPNNFWSLEFVLPSSIVSLPY